MRTNIQISSMPDSDNGLARLVLAKPKLAPLPHLLPGLDKLLKVSGAREMAWTDPAGEMGTPVKVLHGGPAHHLQTFS
jgi:hypothetical protein